MFWYISFVVSTYLRKSCGCHCNTAQTINKSIALSIVGHTKAQPATCPELVKIFKKDKLEDCCGTLLGIVCSPVFHEAGNKDLPVEISDHEFFLCLAFVFTVVGAKIVWQSFCNNAQTINTDKALSIVGHTKAQPVTLPELVMTWKRMS